MVIPLFTSSGRFHPRGERKVSRIEASGGEILTVGHSTRAPGALERLLGRHGVELLVDVRAHPGSRRVPHFAREPLERSLRRAGIAYVHLPELGGRRRPMPASANSAWRNDQFRGYADHMASDEFERGLARLMAAADERRTCVMCAEATWWRCHRRLLADALLASGRHVSHVVGLEEPVAHTLTEFAVIAEGRVTYPAPQGSLEV